jgi:DNA modification methylase
MSDSLRETMDFYRTWLKECKRISKLNGTIWVSGSVLEFLNVVDRSRGNKSHLIGHTRLGPEMRQIR